MAIFACSFDAASPFAVWTTSTGATTTAGRDANGANLASGANLHLAAALGPSIAAGIAYRTSNFSNTICAIQDTSGTPGGGLAFLGHYGDGRLQLTLGSGIGSTNFTIPGFACNLNIWAYFEVVASITQVVTPVTISTSNLTITTTADVYVNDSLLGSYTDSHSILGIANTNIPTGSFSALGITPPGGGNSCTIDDVYVNLTRIGDCFVQSDDATVTIETSAPDVTQTVIEVGIIYPAAAPDITQTVIEVGLQPAMVLACPVGGGAATIGVPYSKALVVTGGTPPYTYEFV